MSKKIIGITVGTRLPKPNFNQTDPTKGDYIKNKPDFDGLQNEVSIIHNLVGDTSVSEQITMATSDLSTKTELEQAIFEKADTVRNAEGTTITLNDSAKTPIQGLNLYGKTTQAGTPTPEAPVPLVSAGDEGSVGVTVSGKNLLENTLVSGSQSGVTWEVGTEGSVTISGTATGSNVFINILKNQKENTVIKMFAGKVIPNTASRTQTTLDGKKATLSEDLNIDGVNGNVYYKISAGMTVNKTYYPQIEFGTTATAYEPYRENQILTFSTPNGLPGIPVTTGGNYTDETGQQWICDEVDFTRGVYVQRIFRTIFKSAVGWSIAGTSNGSKRFYTNQFMGVIKNTKDDATKGCGLCSHFINVTPADTWYEVTGISINSKGRLDIYYSGIEQTTAALEEYFVSNPVAFMAELATPIETPLSAEELAAYAALHTNYPNTTILNDGGAGMEVKYCTPFTSVPMVHGEADSGKILAIDEHGCVTKIEMDNVGSGLIDVDFDISNEGEANLINADTLDGASASEYVKQEGIKDSLSIDLNEIVSGTANPTNADMLGNVPAEKVFSDLDGKLSMELLWENASPTSEFAEQTIPVSSNEYSAVLIEYYGISTAVVLAEYLKKGSATHLYVPYNAFYSRKADFTSGGVSFADCKYPTAYNGWTMETTNTAAIPLRIYGIKGVSE